jgi:hypothetical protein
MRRVFVVLAVVALLCMVGGPASAGWTVVSLNPLESTGSGAFCISGGRQVGGTDGHAILWSGTAESGVDLNPLGVTGSAALSVGCFGI